MPLISLVTRCVLLEGSRSLKRAIERRFLLLPLLLLSLMTGGLGAGDSLAGLHKHHPVLALRKEFSSSQVGGYVTDSAADGDPYVFGPPDPDISPRHGSRSGSDSGSFYHQTKIVRKP
jgi:hypothetical protein